MKKRFLIGAALLVAAVGGNAATLTLEQKDHLLTFGNAQMNIGLDARSGAWVRLGYRGKILLDGLSGSSLGLRDAGGALYGAKTTRIETRRIDDHRLEVTTMLGQWKISTCYRLIPERAELCRSFTIVWTGTAENRIYRFFQRSPNVLFSAGGFYSFPGQYPPAIHPVARLRPGRTAKNTHDPYWLMAGIDDRCTMVWMSDALKPYSDRSWIELTEGNQSVSPQQYFDIAGYMQPGVPQQVGDFQLKIFDKNREETLKSLHSLLASLGHVVPSDRNDFYRKAAVYSFHPGGTYHHPMRDWGGFAESTGQLDRIRQLNCNTIYVLPIEDSSPYIPRDYFRLQAGIGTEDEYRELVATAHRLGLKVWQDIVPHGGKNSCDRARQHPEWLVRDEKGNVPYDRCFDFFHPGWVEYIGQVAQYHMNRYGIDAYRIDYCGGSRIPNWSRDIPYRRASLSQSQGGLAIQRIIRQRARENRPGSGVFAEMEDSRYGAVSDVIYDFVFSKEAAGAVRKLPPEEFVAELRRWLHEQQYAEIADLIHLRHIDSHDTLRAEQLYGPKPMLALVALCAWIHGMPLIHKEMEDGHAPVISEILFWRRTFPALQGGEADYLTPDAPAGVFACLRRNGNDIAIPVINFNPEAGTFRLRIPADRLPVGVTGARDVMNRREVKAEHSRPGMTDFEVTLPPYGFTLLRPGGFSGPTFKTEYFEVKKSERQLPVNARLIGRDGKTAPIVTASHMTVSAPTEALLIEIPVNGAKCVWTVQAAAGRWHDLFRTRHPHYESFYENIHSLPIGHNVLWNSLEHPFGFTEKEACVAFETAAGSIRFEFPASSRPGAVFLLDWVGDNHNPHLLITREVPDHPFAVGNPGFTVDLSAGDAPPEAVTTGDPRLRPIAGGWQFDNGQIRLRLSRTGALAGAWQQGQNLLDQLQPVMVSGYDSSGQLASRWGIQTYAAENDAEAYSRFSRSADGKLKLQFFGRPRGIPFFSKLRANQLNYLVEYTLDNSAGFDYLAGVRPVEPTRTGKMLLALAMKFPSGAGPTGIKPGRGEAALRCTAGKLTLAFHWFGAVSAPEEILCHGNEWRFAWYNNSVPRKDFGRWRAVAVRFSTTGQANTPALPELGDRPASRTTGALLDGDFEFEYQGMLPELAQCFTYALPWQFPAGSRIVTENGNRLAVLNGDSGFNRELLQYFPARLLRPGEVWRLSARVRGENLAAPKAAFGFRLPGTGNDEFRQKLPAGSFEWRRVTLQLTVPTGTIVNPQVFFQLDRTNGKLMIDDVRLEKVSSP